MKKTIFTLALTAVVAGTVLTGCDSSPEKADTAKAILEQSNQDLEKEQQEYNDQYEQFKMESNERIAANEKTILELRAESKKLKKEAKEEQEKTIALLEERNETMKSKIKEFKKDGKEQWESFKNEFSHDMDALGESLKGLTKNDIK